MTTILFGQVKFPSSRAIDDSGDDFEEEISNPYEIKSTKLSQTEIVNVTTVLLTVGLHPCNFAQVYVLPSNAKPDFKIEIYRKESADSKHSVTSTLHGYYLKDSKTVVFTTTNQIDPAICYELNTKIFEIFPASNDLQVFVLDVKSDTNYFGGIMTDDDDGNPFTRKIETSSKINEKTIQPMKIPNTLDGLSAASIDYSISNVVTVLSKSTQFVFFATLWKVISYCEMKNIYAAVILVITRYTTFDADSVNVFRKLKEIPRLTSLIKDVSSYTNTALKTLNKNHSSMFA